MRLRLQFSFFAGKKNTEGNEIKQQYNTQQQEAIEGHATFHLSITTTSTTATCLRKI